MSTPNNPPPTSDDEKSHTFRKRRLSLSRHNIATDCSEASRGDSANANSMASSAAAAAAAFTAEGDDDDGDDQGPPPVVEADPNAEEQKAQTFRKRRLSLTLKLPKQGDLEEEEEDGDAKGEDADDKEVENANASSEEQPQPAKRPRRASDASLNSLNSQKTDGLKVRTLHAGEIVSNRCPPSPVPEGGGAAANSTNNNQQPHVLYRTSRPNSMSMLQQQSPLEEEQPQPKWKKRITRKHDEDERKLPFPRDIVGTYSCHGVEPVYDSDYDPIDEDEEDEDDWTEDIGGGGGGSAKPFRFKPFSSEPKPTTAAKINQDRGGVAFPYGNCPKTALFAAYDGHGQGGELVSQFALHEIQSRLEKRPEFNTDLEKAFKDTFLQVDDALQQEPLIEPLYAGTTACVALLRDDTLTVANAGDSRAVVARRIATDDNTSDGTPVIKKYQPIDLTIDQNPDLPEERIRIESMGGFVSPPPEPGLSARVWLDEGFSQIGLAMARSIGDHAVARVGVIAEPVVSTHTILPEDEFLILATDGVWEFLTSAQAVEIVGANLSRSATKATQALIEAAAARWHDEEGDYRDDITALVIRLSELWKDNNNNMGTTSSETAEAKEPEAAKGPAPAPEANAAAEVAPKDDEGNNANSETTTT